MIVKICGLTRVEDAVAAAEAGADMLGFVFAPSPRRVDPWRAREMALAVGGRPLKVGVFVDEDPSVVAATAAMVGLDLVQLHGSEPPGCRPLLPVRVIRAFGVSDAGSLEAVRPWLGVADYILLDARVPGSAGGVPFDWRLARGMEGLETPWLLAGGLGPKNVGEALAACRPNGVDVSGGVESAPGLKDHDKVREFVRLAKGGTES